MATGEQQQPDILLNKLVAVGEGMLEAVLQHGHVLTWQERGNAELLHNTCGRVTLSTSSGSEQNFCLWALCKGSFTPCPLLLLQVAPAAAAGMTVPQPGSAYHTAPQQQPIPATAAGGLPPGAAPSPVGSAGGFGSRPGSMGGAMPVSPGLPGGLAAASPSLTGGLGSRGSSMGGGVVGGGVTGGPLRAESWSLSSQFGHKGAVKAISEAYDQTLPKIPDPPGKVRVYGRSFYWELLWLAGLR